MAPAPPAIDAECALPYVFGDIGTWHIAQRLDHHAGGLRMGVLVSAPGAWAGSPRFTTLARDAGSW